MDESRQRSWPAGLSRRAAACVRACEGIPTDRLEEGVLVRLVAACVHVADERLRAVLEELVPPRGEALGKEDPPSRAFAERPAAASG